MKDKSSFSAEDLAAHYSIHDMLRHLHEIKFLVHLNCTNESQKHKPCSCSSFDFL